MGEFIATKRHTDIFNWVSEFFNPGIQHSTIGSLIIEAVAGSGKTTTALQMLKYIPSHLDVLYLAFNVSIAQELDTRLKAMGLNNIQALNYHKLGNRSIPTWHKINNDKMYDYLPNILSKYDYRYLYPQIVKLARLVKDTSIEWDTELFEDLSLHHSLEWNGDKQLAFRAVNELLEYSLDNVKVVDFNDMCWIPVKFGYSMQKFDVIIVDELQDTSAIQIELALLNIKKNGLVIGVGDRNQSIYGFRGADVNSIPNLISRLNADTLPLSVTYRNPLSVVDLVNQEFPTIIFEAKESAPNGSVNYIESSEFENRVTYGDMVLCRVNAPLVSYCFSLIRKGIKAQIKGRNIGDGLVSLIKKMKSNSVIDLMTKLDEYLTFEFEKLMRQNKTSQAILLDDKVQTIYALSDGCTSIDEILANIDRIFADDIEGVMFSSIHKAKGLENKNVFILHPELMPHPLAKQDWEKQQEINMKYVAYTRTLENLYIVNA